jgi:hypothetical protein
MKRIDKPNIKRKGRPGRKSKFTEEMLHQVECFAKLGATNKDIAELLDVNLGTVENWLRNKPEFYQAKQRGMKVADAKVAEAAYKSATGYSYEETEISESSKGVYRTTRVKHVPPQPTAFIFWLTNRQPEYWEHANKMKHEHSGQINHNHKSVEDLEQMNELSDSEKELLFDINKKQILHGKNSN